MSRCLALILVVVCLPVRAREQPPPPQPLTREQQEKFAERDRFRKEARELQAEGKRAEAIAAAEKVLALGRAVWGDVHQEVAESLETLAEMHEARDDLPAARTARQEVLAIKTKLLGPQHWQVTDARLALADVDLLARFTLDQRRRLEEANRLNDQAAALWRQQKFAEAIPPAARAFEVRKELLGPEHPRTLTSMSNLGWDYRDAGRVAEAEPLLAETVRLRRKVLGEGHPSYALSLNVLGWLHIRRQRWDEAERCFRQARDSYQKSVGDRHVSYAGTLNNLSVLYSNTGDFPRAEQFARAALEACRQAVGEKHPSTVQQLFNLGGLYSARREFDKAEPLYRQVVELRKQALGQRHPDYATSLRELGALYHGQFDLRRAEPLLREAVQIHQQVLGEMHPVTASSLIYLGSLYRDTAEYDQAEPLLRKGAAIRKRMLGEKHNHYAGSLEQLAGLYRRTGDYGKAEALYREALEISRASLGEKAPFTARVMDTLGRVYRLMGDLARAEALLREAVKIKRETAKQWPYDYAQGLYGLGMLLRETGEYAEAESVLREALEVRRRVQGPKHPDYADSLCSLARLYQDKGDVARAEPLYREALAVTKAVLGDPHPEHVQVLDELAMLCGYREDYVAAEALLLQAIDAARRGNSSGKINEDRDLKPLPITVTLRQHYAQVLRLRAGRTPSAAQLRACDHSYRLASNLLDRFRSEALEHEESKTRHGDTAFDLFPSRVGLLRELFELEGRAEDLEAAYYTAEQGTARVFLEQLGKARALTAGQVSPELRRQEAALRLRLRRSDVQIAGEENRPADRRDAAALGELYADREKAEAELRQLIARLEKEYPQYAALQHPKPCLLAQARACLAPNEVALLFVMGSKQSYVVLVEGRPLHGDRANGLAIYPLPAREEIADGVSCLTDADTLALPVKARSLAEQTYALLLAPLKGRIKGRGLVIVPSGPLCLLPFELLVEDGRFLIENHRIRYAPSLTGLHMVHQWEKTRARPPQPLWALGDPVYDPADPRLRAGTAPASASQPAQRELGQRKGPRGEVFQRLAFSGREVQAIARLLDAPAGSTLTGMQALEAKVKEASASGALARARYVHFATHGLLGLGPGQQPALVLSLVGNDGRRDEDGGVNDGLLRLDEVTRLQLNADLVVLSTCRTGQGRLYSGEGVTGLARAFLYAGSRGVVCSLWAVDDRETAHLMTALYGQLRQGRAAADALRRAKLQMIQDGKPPLDWAPFVLMGE
jgi:CHAT domain-containing protein/tetratricopeptide (TPR) repeat protein